MLLTGKCKEDFLKWSILNRSIIADYHENHILSDIIEWFDSVGIYISIIPSIAIGYENVDFFYFTINNENNRLKFNSRQEAMKQAILKANEIYNEKFG